MRGTKCKIIRMIARQIAIESTTQAETQYDAKRNARKLETGTIVVSHCERAIIKQLKKLAKLAPNINQHVFYQLAIRAFD